MFEERMRAYQASTARLANIRTALEAFRGDDFLGVQGHPRKVAALQRALTLNDVTMEAEVNAFYRQALVNAEKIELALLARLEREGA